MRTAIHFCMLAGATAGLLFGESSGLQAQPDAVHDRPLDASNAWPEGHFGTDYNALDANGFRHGAWVRVYADGSLYYAGSFHHGQPAGSWWFFREDGTAISHVTHDPDSPQSSTAVLYHPNGRVVAHGGYLHPAVRLGPDVIDAEIDMSPARHGTWTLFTPTGELASTLTYSEGVKHGPVTHFLKDGRTAESGSYFQGERDGEWNAYHDNGSLRQTITYRKGTLDGPFRACYNHGQRLSEGAYLDGVEHGSWKFYHKDGELQHIVRYSEGSMLETIYVNGTFTDWHGEERPAYERSYREKVLEGPFREWHDQGEFVLESFNDPETGEMLQRRVMVGTALRREGEYVNGKLDGPVYHYDTQGLLVKTEHFDNGTLVRTEPR